MCSIKNTLIADQKLKLEGREAVPAVYRAEFYLQQLNWLISLISEPADHHNFLLQNVFPSNWLCWLKDWWLKDNLTIENIISFLIAQQRKEQLGLAI